MTVEIPEGLRKAMELRGVDPDKVAEEAQRIRDAGGIDAIPDRHTPPSRRIVEEADRPEQTSLIPEQLSDPDANDIGRFHGLDAGAPDTQREAAIAVYPRTGTDRRRVLDWIATQGARGATDEEIVEALRMPANTERPRRNELLNDGWIVDSGERRRTSTGTDAAAWVLSERGAEEWRRHPHGYDRDE